MALAIARWQQSHLQRVDLLCHLCNKKALVHNLLQQGGLLCLDLIKLVLEAGWAGGWRDGRLAGDETNA